MTEEIQPIGDYAEAPRTPMQQAEHLANSVIGHPLDDDQAIELSKAYAAVALAQVVERVHAAMADIGRSLEDIAVVAQRQQEGMRSVTELAKQRLEAEVIEPTTRAGDGHP